MNARTNPLGLRLAASPLQAISGSHPFSSAAGSQTASRLQRQCEQDSPAQAFSGSVDFDRSAVVGQDDAVDVVLVGPVVEGAVDPRNGHRLDVHRSRRLVPPGDVGLGGLPGGGRTDTESGGELVRATLGNRPVICRGGTHIDQAEPKRPQAQGAPSGRG